VGDRRRRAAGGDPAGHLAAGPCDGLCLGLTVIAGIYVGFAVADGRASVIAVESGVAFRVRRRGRRGGDRIAVAARGRPGRSRAQGPLAAPQPLRRHHALVAALLHGRDWVVAAIIAVEIAAGMHFG
jgi:hypothetical protein